MLASPRSKPASAGRIYSLIFKPASRAVLLFRQVADALPGHGAALGWALPLTLLPRGQAGRDSLAARPGRGNALGEESAASSKTTAVLRSGPPASAGRNHLTVILQPTSLPRVSLAPSLCICCALCLHGKTCTSPAPRYQFIIRLKINLRLLLVSIAQSRKNNGYTCSLFVNPAPYGEL